MQKKEVESKVVIVILAFFIGVVFGLAGPKVATGIKSTWNMWFYPSSDKVFTPELLSNPDIESIIKVNPPLQAKEVNGVLYRVKGDYPKKYIHPRRAFKEFISIIKKYGVPLQVREYPNNTILTGVQQLNTVDDVLNFLNAIESNYWLSYLRDYLVISTYQDDFVVRYRLDLYDNPRDMDTRSRWKWSCSFYESIVDGLEECNITNVNKVTTDTRDGNTWVFNYDTDYTPR